MTSEEYLHQSPYAVAYRHPEPRAPVHVVIAPPHTRYPSLRAFLGAPAEELLGFLRAVQAVLEALEVDEAGYRLLTAPPAPGEARIPGFHVDLLVGEAAPAEGVVGDLILVLLPLAEEPAKAQVEAVSLLLGIEPYEAALLLSRALPRALHHGDEEDVLSMARLLHDLQLPVRCLKRRSLLAAFDPWRVDGVEREEGELVLVGPEGREQLAEGPSLLVLGRYAWSAGEQGACKFAHLYPADGARPYTFLETKMGDYRFLGEDMDPSDGENFERMLDLLAARPEAITCSALLEHWRSARAAGESVWAGQPRPCSSSPDPAPDILSRIYCHVILGSREGPAAS